MKKIFSTSWKASKKPRKQRNYRKNAPLHIKRKFLGTHLSAELRKKHGKRTFGIVTGDTVKVMRGSFKGKETKVERVDVGKTKIYLTGVERAKKDGSKTAIPVNPSNVMITALKLEDAKRKALLSTEKKAVEPKAAADAGKGN